MKKKVKYKFFVSEDVKRCDDITPAQLNELCKTFPEFSNEGGSLFSCEHSYDFDDPRLILLEDFIESNMKKIIVRDRYNSFDKYSKKSVGYYFPEFVREWELEDYESANYFIMSGLDDEMLDGDYVVSYDDPNITYKKKGVKKKKIALFMEMNGLICDAKLKDKIEGCNFNNLVFEKWQCVDANHVIWRISSLHKFPKFTEEWIDGEGKEYVENESSYRVPRGDKFIPHQFVFDMSKMSEQLKEFDIVELSDSIYNIRNDIHQYGCIVCSRNFMIWARKMRLKLHFEPFISRGN